ncbi:MAG: DUF1778 domain-containing protein [Rhodospirillales bacterium]|nr:DUF1778 domain-containing protein [Rhodospirillales bacterium]
MLLCRCVPAAAACGRIAAEDFAGVACTDIVRALSEWQRRRSCRCREACRPIIAEKEARAKRLEIRLPASVKALLTHAAKVRQCSLTGFLLSVTPPLMVRSLPMIRIMLAAATSDDS